MKVNVEDLRTELKQIRSSCSDIEYLQTMTSNDLINLKEIQEKFRTSEETRQKNFQNFQDLNSAIITNIKQTLKSNETQMAMSEKDLKNQLLLLDNKINQKVFTQETLKKIESRFCELDLSCSNIRNEIENIITRINDFQMTAIEDRNACKEKFDNVKEKDKLLKINLLEIESNINSLGKIKIVHKILSILFFFVAAQI